MQEVLLNNATRVLARTIARTAPRELTAEECDAVSGAEGDDELCIGATSYRVVMTTFWEPGGGQITLVDEQTPVDQDA
jgi:hypothetical protein